MVGQEVQTTGTSETAEGFRPGLMLQGTATEVLCVAFFACLFFCFFDKGSVFIQSGFKINLEKNEAKKKNQKIQRDQGEL